MSAVDRAQVRERLLAAQLAEQNAVGAQPQRRFAQVLRTDAGEPLVASRIEKTHRIALRGPQLARVLDHDQPLVRRNLFKQRVEQRGFPRVGSGRNENVLSSPDGEPQKIAELTLGVSGSQRALAFLLVAPNAVGAIESAAALVVFETQIQNGRLADRKHDLAPSRGRQDELNAIPVRKFGGEQRLFFT